MKMWCKEYLQFEPNETPPWRDRLKYPESIPSISQMLQDIIQYKQEEQELLKKTNPNNLKTCKRSLLLTFLLNVQKEEDIGVNNRGKTSDIMNLIDVETNTVQTSAPDSLEDDISGCFQDDEQLTPPKSELETKNLYRAYKKLFQYINCHDENYGLLSIDFCVMELHRRLMEGCVSIQDKVGVFSLNRRYATFNHKRYTYPHFATLDVAQSAVQHVLDRYNSMMAEIKLCSFTDMISIKELFKCASLLLFALLQLHPFCDGNGRLFRLLTSYTISFYSPFMTPIYNVFSSSVESDYVQALVTARSTVDSLVAGFEDMLQTEEDAFKAAEALLRGKPEDLCAMLIESNWTMWRNYLVKLGSENVILNEWEIENARISEV